MTEYLGAAVVTLECPECGSRMKRRADDLQTHGTARCSVCFTTMCIDEEALEYALEQFALAYTAWTSTVTAGSESAVLH